jgi:protein tyrosine phosphatase (PTP) superfamily phosphohydrolase (DUF442 family)
MTDRGISRRTLALSIISLAAAIPALAAGPSSSFTAPNIVEISPTLVTSGQPRAAPLAGLADAGFNAVISLAPPTVPDAVADEAGIVERQGLSYLNIPIRFDNPTQEDFQAFAAALSALKDRKVLVHCQVNMRASSMVFLYRAVVLRDEPQHAYEAVTKVWSPNGRWKQFIVATLRNHGIGFDPY